MSRITPSLRSSSSLLLLLSPRIQSSLPPLHRSISSNSVLSSATGGSTRAHPLSKPTATTTTTTFNTKSSPHHRIPDLPEPSRTYMGTGRPANPISTGSNEGKYARSLGEEQGAVRSIANDRNGRMAVKATKSEFEFGGPSRPRMVYDRPKEARELPEFKNRWPMYIALASLGLGAWGLFLLHATNSERLSSSVLRQITYQLRNSEEVREVLGERVHYAENSWGFGEPWISGTVNLLSGKVDLKFRIEGSKDKGTVYFTSIRPNETSEFQIVRYKIIADSGQVIQMMQTS